VVAAGLQTCTDPSPTETVQATIVVRRRPGSEPHLKAVLRGDAPSMSREEAAQALGADPQSIQEVAQFARSYGLAVTESSAAERCVKVSGTVAQMEAAFGVKLRRCRSGGQYCIYYDQPLTIPSSLAAVVEAVLGLDRRPVASSR